MSETPTEATPIASSRERGFWSLIATQFQGAFSDNVFRVLVIFLVINVSFSQFSEASREMRMAIVGALFAVPFIFFSMAGGFLADRLSKRTVTIGTKVAEIFIMVLALAGLALNNLTLLLATVFLMGTQSAFFGPSKYGLLPELLPEKRLSWGNGIIELGTFLAIIAGTIAGGWLFEVFREQLVWTGATLVGLALVGTFTSLGITRVPPADVSKKFRVNPLADLGAKLKLIRRDRVLWLAVLGNTYFFFIAAWIQQYNIFLYGEDLLGLSPGQITTFLMAPMAVGLGFGSLAAGYLSGKKIEYGLIPLGSIGMMVFGIVLASPGLTLMTVGVNLALLGFFAGFFIVPIAALIQHRPDKERKGSVIAAANLLSFVGIFLAAGVHILMADVGGLDPREIFLVISAVTLVGTAYVAYLLPDFLLRFLLWLLTHSIYRIRVEGRDNIPDKGGALFVCNHLSLVDGLLLIASTDRFIRFIMYKGIYERRLVKPLARIMKVIPISSEVRPREMIRSLQEARASIEQGDVVCIFAEGQVTRIGQMLPFRRGFEQIMKDVDAPIIPVSLDGIWGSIFSHEKGRFLWKIPRRIPYPVTVSFGKPMSPTSKPFEVRQAVQELNTASWHHRRARMQPIHRAFVNTARKAPFSFAMADARVPKLRFGSALTRTIFLARRLKKHWQGQDTVGILLPPSVAGALVNFAALLMGKVPVNLNYTASDEILASCAQQCGIQTVVTSKAFLDRVKLKVPGRSILLEDVAQHPRLGEKLLALVMTWTLPVGWLEKAVGCEKKITLDDLATIIFSSGSTGDPKGVMLTHYNMASNIEQIDQIFALNPRDRLLGILPFFHSFGFTVTLCLPAALRTGIVYHSSPLEASVIGGLVRQYAVTFLLATPTFLQMYTRGCASEDFGSLQFVMAGAEKLQERVALAFEEKFGIRPLEGYGCTECSPVVAVNTRDYRDVGFYQVGAKRGKIGHPLPGISVRIVDPDTLQPLPVNQAGLLLVRGPNVMKGYLGRPEKTAEVLRDGWYVTGDIAAQDEHGFLEITDRLSRFSKIGGEMVPHIKVEEELHELADVTERTFVVTGVPDEKKGERLVVLHTLPENQLKEVLRKLSQVDLPNLWIPRGNQFFHVEALPLLGSGKMDLRKVRQRALEFSPV